MSAFGRKADIGWCTANVKPRPGTDQVQEGHPDTRPSRTIAPYCSRRPREGVYVAFPFLAGTRPSEQLGLLWVDVDFDANVIRIQRMQERDGSITNFTKTVAGTRDVPMCSLLRTMLM